MISTQVLVLDALGAARPTFAHVPLVVDAAGKKLSKRRGPAGAGPEEEASEDGARGRRPRKHAYEGLGTVAELRAAGCTPLGLANYLASLGWAHETAAFDSLDDLAAAFDLGRVSKAASAHEGQSRKPGKMDWLCLLGCASRKRR